MRVLRRGLICSWNLYFCAGLLCAAQTPAALPQAGTASSAGASGAYRPCSTNPVLENKSKKANKTKHPVPPEPAPACLEVKGEGIEIQEFLQSMTREQQWRVGENHASEDTWSFVRYLGEEDLEKYADTKVLTEPVNFSGGKVAILVRTSDIADGYVRVQVSTRFQGEGKTSDKVLGQPGTVWPLNSRGVLEQEVLGALQTRFHHAG
jgi:hypothetical protein